MTQFKKILIPTDGSDNTRPAISYALSLAKFMGADVTAMCVTDVSNYASTPGDTGPDVDSPIYKASETAVRYAVDQGRSMGLRISPVVVIGIPATEIIAASKDHDLIVMGTLGRTGLAHLLLGSVAEKVVRLASCPVMVIHGTEDLSANGSIVHRMLIPTDSSDNTKPAIREGLELAKITGAEVTAIFVGDLRSVSSSVRSSGKADQYLLEIGQKAVDYVVGEGLKLGIEVRTKIVTGSPEDEIVRASSDHDLIVMGTNGRTGLTHLRIGSVAESTVRNAKCPVLVVRSSVKR